jgi:hypothetical protein
MNNQAAQTIPELHGLSDAADYLARNPADEYAQRRFRERMEQVKAALSQPAGVPEGWRKLVMAELTRWMCARDAETAYARLTEALAASPAASGGEDIADAVDDPNGTCPTCHQYLRTDAIQQPPAGAPVSERARGYRQSTHHVHRGPESLPCYCTATIDHQIGKEASDGEALARRFHETYERLAPSFGYETRTETRQFDPTTPNGRLMIAVCSELALEQALTQQRGDSLADAAREIDDHWEAPRDSDGTIAIPIRRLHKLRDALNATTPQPGAEALRELVQRWRGLADSGLRRSGTWDGKDMCDRIEKMADELESLLARGG